jgi:hypothetical protein
VPKNIKNLKKNLFKGYFSNTVKNLVLPKNANTALGIFAKLNTIIFD